MNGRGQPNIIGCPARSINLGSVMYSSFTQTKLVRDKGEIRAVGAGAGVHHLGRQTPPDDLRVSARGLRKTYSGAEHPVHALQGVDFHVARGEFVGVLGPNGAGKTTLIEILEGIRYPDSGEVCILGADVTNKRQMKGIRGRMGISLQHSTLPPRLTIRELMTLQTRLYGSTVSVDRMIEMVGVGEKAGARIEHLSGGQQQRVAVAMALMGDPELLFLDEPTSQLDPHARLALWEVLYAQRDRRDASVVITTHQMEEAQKICDRVVIIDRGKVIAEGRPKELVRTHLKDRAVVFYLPMEVQVDLAALGGRSAPAGSGLKRITISTEQPSAMLIRVAEKFGDRLVDLTVEEPSLEQLFVKLTGTDPATGGHAGPALKGEKA
jgi:ABC-2 type transport system ATP-binding protein